MTDHRSASFHPETTVDTDTTSDTDSLAARLAAEPSPDQERELARQATAPYFVVENAREDGYTIAPADLLSGGACRGVPFLNQGLLDDGSVEVTRPEGLLYDRVYGHLLLVGAVYLGRAARFDDRPILFGEPMTGPRPLAGGDETRYYVLFAWLWRPNPEGTFAPFNPTVNW